MKILVTGACGQLGREIMRQSLNSEHAYMFTDISGSKVDIYGDVFEVRPLDIADPEDVKQAIPEDIDVIINCAAYTDVNGAETDHSKAERINVTGPAVLAAAAATAPGHPLLIHISTDYIFDGKANTPYTEEASPDPLNFYGRTKMMGEKAILDSGCRYMIFRSSWMYSSFGKNFFLTMDSLTASRAEVNVVFDQTGTPTCAADLAYLIYYITEEGMLDRTGIYNYSNEGTCTWYDFAKEINDLLGHTCRIIPCRSSEYPSPAARPAYSVLDKKKVRETFGIEIPHWKDSLKLTVQEYYENK